MGERYRAWCVGPDMAGRMAVYLVGSWGERYRARCVGLVLTGEGRLFGRQLGVGRDLVLGELGQT